MEFFSPTFRALIKKLHFTKYYSFDPRCSKLIFKTGNGIISRTSGLLIKNMCNTNNTWLNKQNDYI